MTGGATSSSIANSGTIQSTGTGARAIRFVTSTTANVTITNNAGALIQSQSDALQSNINIATGAVRIDNSGTIQAIGTGSNNGQAIDFNNIAAGTATVVLNNYATGVVTAADADAIRAANGMVINNFGSVVANWATGANGNDSGNDAIDFNTATYNGTVNNYKTGLISGARHGITAAQGITVLNYGTIVGNDGGGLNIDTTTNAQVTTVTNYGAIIGTARSADGDAIDVDRLLTLNNYGTIKAVGTTAAGVDSLNEAVAVGGGTINNYVGGLIYSDQRAITVDDSSHGNAFAAVNIYNAGTIQGANGEAIVITSTFANTLTNSGTIIGRVAMGAGNDAVTIQAGSRIVGLVDGGAGTDNLTYQKVGLSADKMAALQAGGTVNIGGTLYTGFESFTGSSTRSFSSFAGNGQTAGVASILDNMSTTQAASAATQSLIDQVASAGDPASAMAQLTPTAFQALTSIGVSNAAQTGQMVDQRLSNVRSGGPAMSFAGLGALSMLDGMQNGGQRLPSGPTSTDAAAEAAFAFAADGRDRFQDAFAAVTKAPPKLIGDDPWGFFLYGNAVFARQGATSSAPQSKFTATGITAGIDRRINDNLILGILGGYTRTFADLDTLGSTSKIETWLIGGYGTWYGPSSWFVNGAMIYGRNSYDNKRVALGQANTSSPNGSQFALQGSVGRDYRSGRFTVTPEAGLQYTAVMVDGYTETGAAALSVQSDRADSLRSSLGARVRTDWAWQNGVATPELRASWQHEFLDKTRDIRASFVDQALPGTFTTTAAGAGTDFGVVGAGLSMVLAERTQLSLGYDFKFGGRDFTAHQISGRVRHTF
ncbi:hypothetical protein ASD45_14040 [Pseudolabrys sp. Root1462]|uniref:autotransporter family protein n=1 Tax=Pseudolabrys sp. Root1462 TaxID=1736466 RepID=UPI0007036BDE|nr:autotransporter outer membrane beta-barrel domain-containing protein [Pseudolabrys sp. Root1462]KQZ01845.1 hypothetical protein ASD45_14040 [Pseudolabrys sp. Root1462]